MSKINHERISEMATEYTNKVVDKRAKEWWKVHNAYKRGCYAALKFLNGETNSEARHE